MMTEPPCPDPKGFIPCLPEDIILKLCSYFNQMEEWEQLRSINKIFYRAVNKMCYGRKVHTLKVAASITFSQPVFSISIEGNMETKNVLISVGQWKTMCPKLWSMCKRLKSLEMWGLENWPGTWDAKTPFQTPMSAENAVTCALLMVIPDIPSHPPLLDTSGFAVTLDMFRRLQQCQTRQIERLVFLPRAPIPKGHYGLDAFLQLIHQSKTSLTGLIWDLAGMGNDPIIQAVHSLPLLTEFSCNMGKFGIQRDQWVPEKIQLDSLISALKGKKIISLEISYQSKILAAELTHLLESLQPATEFSLNLPNFHMLELISRNMNKNRPIDKNFETLISPDISEFAANLEILHLGRGLKSAFMDEDLFCSFPKLRKITGVTLDRLAAKVPCVLLNGPQPLPLVEILHNPIKTQEQEWEYYQFLDALEKYVNGADFDKNIEIIIHEESSPLNNKVWIKKYDCSVEIFAMRE